MTAKKLNRRQARWSLYLSRFDFDLHHKPGRSMGKSDALSRRPDHGSGREDNENIVLLRPELFAIRAMEGLTFEGEEKEIARQIRDGVKRGQMEDAVAGAVKRLRETKGRSLRSAEWRIEDGLWRFRERIYVPNSPSLRRRIVAQHHDTKVAGHPGRWKTLELVSRTYWWPQMSRYIGLYCKACDLCLRTKAQRRKPFGELQPLPIPESRWETVSVDFITELPESHGFDAIMTAVDSTGKRAHFIPTHTTVTAAGAARLYLNHIWKLHGLPRNILSDRGTQFVAEFMRELCRLLSIKISTSTAYHPQSDGQTERVNQEIEQYLRLFVDERQDDWDELTPMAEFTYNNHVHSSTQHTPFYIDTGRHPRMGFEPRAVESKVEAVNEFVDRMKSTLEEAKAALSKSKDDMARYYNQRRTPTPTFAIGDKVYLDASDIKTTRPSKKLAHRYLGPFKVVRPVGTHAYRLQLPPSMSRLHPVFPVIKLLPKPIDEIEGRRTLPPPPPVIVHGEDQYEVEAIMDSRLRWGKLEFLVSWKGYGYEENSWTPETDVNAPRLVKKFYRDHPGAPRRIQTINFCRFNFQKIDHSHRDTVSWRGGDVRGTPNPPSKADLSSHWRRPL
jgi:transposase InsO family protein